MTDEQPPGDEELPDDGHEDAPDLPPPSTFAGKARKAEEQGEEPDGLTEEFAGLEKELSAEIADEEKANPADEQEEPPDEFAFEEEPEADEAFDGQSEEELEDDGASEGEHEADTEAGNEEADAETSVAQISSATVEADTLTLADVEAQREAAHAGLTKRAEKSTFSHEVTTGSHQVQPPAATPPVAAAIAATGGDDEGVGKPPKRRIGWRFMTAAFVIVSSMAAATAVSFLLFLSDIAEGLNDSELSAARAQLAKVEGGDPQTILILGSDKREADKGDPGRSDTAILLRVDPEKEFLSLMSLPRDLVVPIPGYGPEKLNAAYSFGQQEDPTGGGETLAIKTITQYLDIPINHVVNVDFSGFYEAVNAIGCVYVDVDRHYFHSNEGILEGSEDFYSEIDVEAGYQRLCGYKALQYVRYRHGDNDLVRGARQQDFIREARQRIPPTKLLPVFGEGDELIDIFTKNTSSDINNVPTIVGMMKSFVSVRNAPVRQVTLGELSDDGGVDATSEEVDSAVSEFLGDDLDAAVAEAPAAPSGGGGGGEKKPKPKPKPADPVQAAPLVDFTGPSQEKAAEFAQTLNKRKADLPVYYPTKLVQSTITAVSDESRAAALVGSDGKTLYQMYKYVLPYQESFGPGYYGVSGTNWDNPPILQNPSETRTIKGREFLLYYEQDRVRLVGWQTSKGSYWVTNTLTHALTEAADAGDRAVHSRAGVLTWTTRFYSVTARWRLSVNR